VAPVAVEVEPFEQATATRAVASTITAGRTNDLILRTLPRPCGRTAEAAALHDGRT
jgi:hypothetical protein